jgi:hypothetical protein
MLTVDEMRDKLLAQYDAELLLELLQINSEELLDRFEDRLETHYETIRDALVDQ